MTMNVGYAISSVILLGSFFVTLGAQLAAKGYHPPIYWAAILFSNTLGTALGDFLADDSGLGFAGGALLIGGLIALVVIATFLTKISRVFLFWVAFVLTRPFGATLGDVLTKSTDAGGLNFGTKGTSAILAMVLLLLIVYSVWTAKPSVYKS